MSRCSGKGHVARRGVGGRQRRQSPVVGIGIDREFAIGRTNGIMGAGLLATVEEVGRHQCLLEVEDRDELFDLQNKG